MIPRAPCALVALALLGGCVSKKNDGLGLGGTVTPEAVSVPGPGIALSSDRPSVSGLSREDWERTEFLVPVQGVAHKPMYAKSRSRLKVTPRHRGEYPTEASSLDLVAGSAKAQRREAVWAPVRAIGSAILVVPKAIVKRRPWQAQWSPRDGYRRYWDAPAEAAVVETPAPPGS